MTTPPLIRGLSREMLDAIAHDASHFPALIQSRGRLYHAEGRVGALEIDGERVGAAVRGGRTYRAVWQWDGVHANPLCTCDSGPICKHAFALARAIDVARRGETGDDARTVNAGRGSGFGRRRGTRDGATGATRTGEGGDTPITTDAPGETQATPGAVERTAHADASPGHAPETATDDLARWARRRARAGERSLRVVLGLGALPGERPHVWLELRESSQAAVDAPRTAFQIIQLVSDLKRDPLALSPPHARLLRVVGRSIPQSGVNRDTRFPLKASTLNRLLDSFSDSPLATWGEGLTRPDQTAGGVATGERMRLGAAKIDIVPMGEGEGAGMRIVLAARWPDGRLVPFERIVYLPSDDDLNPGLVLADGAFWRVSEDPPARLLKRLGEQSSLPVPESGRERFLDLLATSFPSMADALSPHVRVHPARPVVTLDLDADDWLCVRLFAHTGDASWRPGVPTPGVVAFELDADAQWVRLDESGAPVTPTAVAPEDDERDDASLAVLGVDQTSSAGEPDDAVEAAHLEAGGEMPEGEAGEAGEAGADDAPEDDEAPPVWIDLPDSEALTRAREWLGALPAVRRTPSATPTPAASTAPTRGGWIRLSARNLRAFADAWDVRPREAAYLGNRRMQNLLGEARVVRPSVRVASSGVDWFTISAEWQAEGMALTEADLARLRSARTRFVKLSSGWVRREWADAHDAAAGVLADLGVEAGGGEQRLSLAQLAGASPESLAALDAFAGGADALAEIERLRERVRAFDGLPRVDVPASVTATLRPYQHEGLDFLAYVTELGLGAVLADDMGLGKTIQALAWIEWLKARDPDGGPTLVVCPASVLHNWQREAERFVPGMKVLALTSGEARHALRREVPDHDLVITTYALLRRDLERWRSIPLRAAILDEAQMVKNPNAAVSRAVLELKARHRLALTGTPIENRALDLWSIMQFVNPGYLGRRTTFVTRYDRPDAAPHVRRLLSARLRPVMVRRLKEQVATDLPDRIEERRECELTPGQRKLYVSELMRGRETVQRLRSSAGGTMGHRFEVLAALTRLRQVCCHPALVGGRESLGSGKFDALFELLEPLLAEGRKVLVFSQFVECLKLLADEMMKRGIKHHMLTGATTRREAVVTGFETDPEPCIFLISLKAGGVGLNLTAASYVVLFDPWWNPAVEAQAIDRAHRIGQTRTVIAYRMLAADTIEEKIYELQQRKAALVSEVLGEEGFARSLTQEDLDYLLG